jgi:aquaporin Z
MVLDKRTTPMDAVGYILSQIIGAIAAALIVAVAVSQQAVTNGITAPGAGITDAGAVIIETVATAIFLAVILASTKRAPALAALVIPLTLVAIHFGIATLSGASVNPARSLGSAIVGGDISKIWIYIVGPIIGGILGWLAWRLIDGGAETYPAQQPAAEEAA